MSVHMITAGAGSGKTYRICEEIVDHFAKFPELQPANLIVTTFTKKAAAELRERVASRLMKTGDFDRVSGLSEARIGTVHSICLQFLKKYGYLIGQSPELNVIPDGEDAAMMVEIMEGMDLGELHRLELKLSMTDSRSSDNAYPNLIKRIIELARNNGVDSQSIVGSADKSIQSFNNRAGDVIELDEAHLLKLLDDQYAYFFPVRDELRGKNKAFFESVESLRDAYGNNNHQAVPWGLYLKLLAELNVGYRKQVLPLQQYVSEHHRWSIFRSDIEQYTRSVFAASSEILDRYRNRKLKEGLIDNSDMEAMMLDLLRNNDFRTEFSHQYKLVLIDEFQDTSPMQLQIFRKWAELSQSNVWVGDLKQSIYGFRGADSALVQSVLDTVPPENQTPLPVSYRSRRELVEAANTIFVNAFAEMDDQLVKLEPDEKAQFREDMKAPFNTLDLAKENFNEYLAKIVRQMIDEGWIVFDKEDRSYRPVKSSDICILLRAEGEKQSITNMRRALIKQHIPVSQRGGLLMEQAEVYFLFAILRYLVNKYDQFAIAQILYFSSEKPSVSRLMEDRVEYLVSESKKTLNYGADNNLIKQLDELKYLSGKFTITQLLGILFFRTDFQSIVGKWGMPETSTDVINRLLGLAGQYSGLCSQLQKAEGIYGFMDFVRQNAGAPSNDELKGDGVSVITYHGAKGLEWPVVFLCSMDNEAKGKAFQPVVMDNGKGDYSFEGRWIRFWPWPYAFNVTRAPLNEIFREENDNILGKSWEEEKRLLYVGFTRARDYLFLVTKGGSFKWFDKVCGNDWQATLADKHYSPVRPEFNFDRVYNTTDPKPINVVRRHKQAELRSPNPYFIAPSRTPLDISYKIATPIQIGDYLGLLSNANETEEANLGNLFHHYFGVPCNAKEMIRSYSLSHLINPEKLEVAYGRLKEWTETEYPGAVWHSEWPITFYHDGHSIQGLADLILELPDRLVLIDHKSFPGGISQLQDRISSQHYTGQLAWYKKAIEAAEKKPLEAVYLHFPVSSAIVGIEFPGRLF